MDAQARPLLCTHSEFNDLPKAAQDAIVDHADETFASFGRSIPMQQIVAAFLAFTEDVIPTLTPPVTAATATAPKKLTVAQKADLEAKCVAALQKAETDGKIAFPDVPVGSIDWAQILQQMIPVIMEIFAQLFPQPAPTPALAK